MTFRFENEPWKIAEKLYELTKDMDFADYEETKEKEIAELENAMYQLKAMAENEYNQDYWRTLWNCLKRI